MAMIGFAIIKVPQMTGDLIAKMSFQTIYSRMEYIPKGRHAKHVVICGDIKSSYLQELFEELFHQDHETENLFAVILQPDPPSFDLVKLLQIPKWALCIYYLQGSALIDNDLKRAKVQTAVAVFIMANKFSADADEEDSQTILHSFSISKFISNHKDDDMCGCNRRKRSKQNKMIISMQLIRPENRKHLLATGNKFANELVVCINEIKMGVLSKSIMFPGTTTFLMNLIFSFSDNVKSIEQDSDDSYEDNSPSPPADNSARSANDAIFKNWYDEYEQGCEWEIYTTSLSSQFTGIVFCELSSLLYVKLGIVLFAIQIHDLKGQTSKLLLNPPDYVIPDPSSSKYRGLYHFSKCAYLTSFVSLVEAFVVAKNKASSDLSLKNSKSAQDVERNNLVQNSLRTFAFSKSDSGAMNDGNFSKLPTSEEESDVIDDKVALVNSSSPEKYAKRNARIVPTGDRRGTAKDAALIKRATNCKNPNILYLNNFFISNSESNGYR